MNSNIILVVLGEPNSTFSEILLKYFKSKEFKKNKIKIILIGNRRLFERQMRKLNYNFLINEITDIKKSSSRLINIINVDYKFKKIFSKITTSSRKYIENCFDLSLKLIKNHKLIKLVNGQYQKNIF